MTTTEKNPMPEMDCSMRQVTKQGTGRRATGVAMALVVLAGCDVVNPGPVQDEFLNQPEAHQSLVNGAGRRLSLAISSIGYSVALASREILPAGQTGSGGNSPVGQAGVLLSGEVGSEWNNAQQARWIAEDAIKRFTTIVPAGKTDPLVLTQAYLFLGYANRTMGENFCDAVFDGGAKEPHTKYLERAQAAFTSAIASAPNTTAGTNLKNAALAGRAATRVALKDWTGAVADANLVPANFVYRIPLSLEDIKANGDDLYWANANSPYRSYSLWGTWFEKYYDETGDARAAYTVNPAIPLAQQQLSGFGAVPWKTTQKFNVTTDHKLASYNEMLLIKAEAALLGNDIGSALALINQVHTAVKNLKTGANLAALPVPGTLVEAWTLLKRERALDMYLDGRRLGDMRRWKANATPGTLDWPNFEAISVLFRTNVPSECIPISDGELNTNPNLG